MHTHETWIPVCTKFEFSSIGTSAVIGINVKEQILLAHIKCLTQ